MDKDQLDNAIALHAQWLASGGQQGRRAEFEDADLRQADLRGVDLSYANLAGANFERAELAGAKLANANLSSVALGYANLTDASLVSANLERAIAIGADFTRADLTQANLSAARLDYGVLRDTTVESAVAKNARLVHCDITGTRFNKTDLQTANLKHTNSCGIQMSEAQIELLKSPPAADWNGWETNPALVERRRLVRSTRLLAKLGVAVTLGGITVAAVMGLANLYLLARYRTTEAAIDFDYAWAFVISVAGLITTTAAVIIRLKVADKMNRIVSGEE